jgi:alpha-ketoglutarate-dependent taurine dioxygenase
LTTIELTIERGDDSTNDWRELTVEVRGTVTRERPATRYDPAEGGEVEIDSVTCNGQDFELDADEEDKAMQLLERQAREDTEEARCRRWDWAREERLEREI